MAQQSGVLEKHELFKDMLGIKTTEKERGQSLNKDDNCYVGGDMIVSLYRLSAVLHLIGLSDVP